MKCKVNCKKSSGGENESQIWRFNGKRGMVLNAKFIKYPKIDAPQYNQCYYSNRNLETRQFKMAVYVIKRLTERKRANNYFTLKVAASTCLSSQKSILILLYDAADISSYLLKNSYIKSNAYTYKPATNNKIWPRHKFLTATICILCVEYCIKSGGAQIV